MKLILICLLSFAAPFVHAQRGGLTVNELKQLAGTWTGTFTFTGYGDDTTRTSIPARLEIKTIGDSLAIDYTYAMNGEITKEYGGLHYLKEQDQLLIDGETYLIAAVRRKGVRLTVIADMEGNDNSREATIRKTITMGPGVLIIVKEVRYNTARDFFVRNKMELTKQ